MIDSQWIGVVVAGVDDVMVAAVAVVVVDVAAVAAVPAASGIGVDSDVDFEKKSNTGFGRPLNGSRARRIDATRR